MKITATVENATSVADHVWYVPATLDQVVQDATVERLDLPTILAVHEPQFDENEHTLQFDFTSADVLILGGRSHGSLVIQSSIREANAVRVPVKLHGDEVFRNLLKSMAPHIRSAGEDLLSRVRELDPDGEFERHGRRFVNRPDNFVALEPQTRLNEIIVHVRGNVEVHLPPVSTQRGYSAFKVRSPNDLLEAGSALGRARRRF